jgi:hypothetical protein
MDGSVSTSTVGSGETSRRAATSPPPSKLKTYGFAIAIIVGVGGLAVGAAGLVGYFHVGALSNMAQVDAIIMMAVGGGGGTILLIIGVVGTVKNRQSSSRQRHGDVHVDSEHGGATRILDSIERTEIIRPPNTQDGLVYGSETCINWDVLYGPDMWKIWGIEVLDVAPLAPRIDLSKGDTVLIYIPQRIRVNGKEQDFTLKALKEICGDSFRVFDKEIERQFGHNMASGWVLMGKNVIPESRGQDYETQKRMLEGRGCGMPSVLEAAVLNLMVFAFTEERLYGREPWTYTRCTEKVDGQYPVVVGAFGSDGLYVYYDDSFGHDNYGAAGALREF